MPWLKPWALIAIVMLCLPLAAWGDSVTFQNKAGTFTAINGGTALELTGSRLTSVSGLGAPYDGTGFNLGSVSLTTGALLTGSLDSNATFAAGGSFSILGNSGLVFNGTFTSASWSVAQVGSGFAWTFTGVVTGLLNGVPVTAATVQLTTITMGNNPFLPGHSGHIKLSGGDTTIGSVPETDTLTLMGLGLVGMSLLYRRRLFSGWNAWPS